MKAFLVPIDNYDGLSLYVGVNIGRRYRQSQANDMGPLSLLVLRTPPMYIEYVLLLFMRWSDTMQGISKKVMNQICPPHANASPVILAMDYFLFV